MAVVNVREVDPFRHAAQIVLDRMQKTGEHRLQVDSAQQLKDLRSALRSEATKRKIRYRTFVMGAYGHDALVIIVDPDWVVTDEQKRQTAEAMNDLWEGII